jgi:hypothetical protein
MDAQERPFSLVFLWAYKEKVTRQQAKPKLKTTPIMFTIARSGLRMVCCFTLAASHLTRYFSCYMGVPPLKYRQHMLGGG